MELDGSWLGLFAASARHETQSIIVASIRAGGATSFPAIADQMNQHGGISTARGGRWHACTVRDVEGRAVLKFIFQNARNPLALLWSVNCHFPGKVRNTNAFIRTLTPSILVRIPVPQPFDVAHRFGVSDPRFAAAI